MPDAVVEESAAFDRFEFPGAPFRRAVVEVALTSRASGDECAQMCALLGQEVLPRLERHPAKPAFSVGGSGALLSGEWLGTVEAGVGVLQEDVAFIVSVGGLAGAGDVRTGYMLRGKVFFPTLLDSGGRWYMGLGAATMLTGESFATQPEPTTQHYLGQLLAGVVLVEGDFNSLAVELSGFGGLERRTVSTISGTRVVPLSENNFGAGGSLGLNWSVY